MIIVLSEMAYPAESDGRMRSVVPTVEQFCQAFDGCERFALSFPAGRVPCSPPKSGVTPRCCASTPGPPVTRPSSKNAHGLLTDTRHEVFSAEPPTFRDSSSGSEPRD